jgi:hypothetical protein
VLVRDRGVLFTAESNGDVADLRYIRFGPDAAWRQPTAVASGVQRRFAVIEPDRELVLYVKGSGLYLAGPLGFGP